MTNTYKGKGDHCSQININIYILVDLLTGTLNDFAAYYMQIDTNLLYIARKCFAYAVFFKLISFI